MLLTERQRSGIGACTKLLSARTVNGITLIKYKKCYGVHPAKMPELNVLLTVKDRPQFTRRWLDYASRVSLPFAICIADGGCNDAVPKLLEENSYANISITYIRFTPDESYRSYYAKIRTALEEIESEFCLMADDDDFYSVDGICRCIGFLKVNTEFAACQGLTFQFTLSAEQSLLYAKSTLFGRALMPFYDFLDKSADLRLARLSNKNVRVWYAVQRTADVLGVWRFIESAGIEDLFLAEMAFSFAIVARGNVKCLNVPYYFRQHVTANSSNQALHATRGNLASRMRDPAFMAEVEKISNWLARKFKPEHASLNVFENTVREALGLYIRNVLSSGKELPASNRVLVRLKLRLKQLIIDTPLLSSFVNWLTPRFNIPESIRKQYFNDTDTVIAVITRRPGNQ